MAGTKIPGSWDDSGVKMGSNVIPFVYFVGEGWVTGVGKRSLP